MVNQGLSVNDFGQLVAALLRPTVWIELAVLAACLGLAWVLVRLLRGPLPKPDSIWFGVPISEPMMVRSAANCVAASAPP